MSYLKRSLLSIVPVTLLVLLVAVSAQRRAQPATTYLGIEIATSWGPLYLPAATNRGPIAVIRVPISKDKGPLEQQVSAVKVVPRMEGDKAKVTVYALYGDISQVTSCSELNNHPATLVATYVAGQGEALPVSALRNLGGKLGQGPLSILIVPKRAVDSVEPVDGGGGCGCGSCGQLQCCPSGGHCLGCGLCGEVCCPPSGGD
jgi:hypothetical protein